MLSLFITLVLIPILKEYAVRVECVDVPCERKVHSLPMPKVGGIAMAIGALIPVILWLPTDRFINSLLIGSGIIVIFGFIDDMRELGYKAKLTGQLAAALVVIFYGGLSIRCMGACLPEGTLLPTWMATPLTLLAIIGVTNAINLSDGLDGLAGGIAVLIFLCIAYLAFRAGSIPMALLAVSVIGAVFGFLRYNTYPAVIFMGDAGSQLLGFLAVCMSISLTQDNQALSQFLPLIILGFPILDTLTVMIERLTKGHSPFKADKNHFHHKLMRLGLYHTEAVFTIYVLQSFLIVSAVVFRFHSEWFWLFFYSVFSGMIISTFAILERRQWQLPRRDLIDQMIKGRLKFLKEQHILIKVSFRTIEFGLPLLLLVSCLLVQQIPGYFASLAGLLAVTLVTLQFVWPPFAQTALRLSLYIVVPFLVYLVESAVRELPLGFNRLYHLTFGVMVMFVILTLKFTRRRKGFKTTPMDFLVLFIALLVPNIPDTRIQSLHMGMIAAQIIVFLFGFEVMIGELRGELKRQTVFVAIALSIIPLKYFLF